jgi:GDPmannose 4,6-dehydratase
MKIPNAPKIFITGVTGQDGAHLANLLLSKGYNVSGGFRRGTNKFWRLDYLGITEKITLIEFQLSEPQSILAILQEGQFDEIYHLAAESFVADSFKYPIVTLEANTHAVCNMLEAARLVSPNSRMFFASSSEIYGSGQASNILSEMTPPNPSNPYAISKLAADHFVRLYRETYGLFVCSGILFNHEGPLRGRQFVTRKITYNLARLKIKGGDPLVLGNLNAGKDWGSAVDYVEAMRLMLSSDKAQDYIIATGKLSTVRDLLRLGAISAGFQPIFEGEGVNEICKDVDTGLIIAEVSERYFRPFDTPAMIGDSSKIEIELGWRKNSNLEQMISEMVSADINRWKIGDTNV